MTDLFKDLFILEIANNHQGSVEHGKNLIRQAARVAHKYGIKAGIKFQYRDLDTFIHPDFKERNGVPHISRFMETRLSDEQFVDLFNTVREEGMSVIVTPFDEASVQKCIDHGADILKIASCSADDWPLVEEVARAGKPVVASTGGLSLSQIDNLVSFFEHKNVAFALMHCVSLYPAPSSKAQMTFLRRLCQRYPAIQVGYSGHEAHDNFEVGKVAVAVGAQLLERHIGLPTDTIKTNEYSMNLQELDLWLGEIMKAKEILGGSYDKVADEGEQKELRSLKRGVFAKKGIGEGTRIQKDDVFFAMPLAEGQLTSGEFGQYGVSIRATRDYKPGEAVRESAERDSVYRVRDVLHECKGMLREAGIAFGKDGHIEISHHYGMERFREVGCTMIHCVNRNYCKKLIIVLPGQYNPSHRHDIKEETLRVLYGGLKVDVDGQIVNLVPGDQLLIPSGKWHDFSSSSGAIFEEISTTHIVGDSYYRDEKISSLDPMQRKTILESW